MRKITRRDFLRKTCCTAAAAGIAASSLNRLGLMSAYAQGSDYKSLVCIFMFGGNDANNMIIPYSNSDYANYANIRAVLALPQSGLLPVQPKSLSSPYSFHPKLVELQNLFNGGQLAAVVNAGTLVQPTTQAQYLNRLVNVPVNLFSHADQQQQMQTANLNPYSSNADIGWGGRLADEIQSIYGGSFPVMISLAGINLFAEGLVARAIETSGSPTLSLSGFSSSAANQARLAALQSLLTFETGMSLIQTANTTTTNAIQDAKTLAAALAQGSAFQTKFPTSSLGGQLLQVAQIIQVRAALGLPRQIFFVSTGGFDTHSGQITQQNTLYQDLSQSMSAFYQATVEMGIPQQVSTFTLSDFGRTLLPETTSGSDHGWGSHHLVMGGGVVGGDFYGTWPTLALGGPNDATNQGRWIPTTSLDQYAATLAQWFGVPISALPSIFPNLQNFPTQTLGFMAT